MSKVLFVNGNVHGHINPTIPLVKELSKRGEEVVYFSTVDFKEKIEASGAHFMPYGEQLDAFLKSFKPTGNHPFYTLVEFMLKMDEAVIPIVIDRVKGTKFDYMIHDSMFGGGKVLSRILGIPAVCSCTSFAMNRLPMPPHMFEKGFHPQLDNLYIELKRAAEVWNQGEVGIMDIFFKKESLNLVYTSKLFQPHAEVFDESFRFTGPSIYDRNENINFSMDDSNDGKIIYISMGTINNNCTGFYQDCIKAFEGTDFKVIMSVGNKADIGLLGAIPENFSVHNYVPQIEVLKKTNVFISHGGLNSVSEALYFGVPVIAIPQANDQHMVTGQLEALGAGIGLKMNEITSEVLRDSANRILADGSYKAASERIGASFKAAGGYTSAADYIMEFKEGK